MKIISLKNHIENLKTYIQNTMYAVNDYHCKDFAPRASDPRPLHAIRECQITHLERVLNEINRQMRFAIDEIVATEKKLSEPLKIEAEERNATTKLQNLKKILLG